MSLVETLHNVFEVLGLVGALISVGFLFGALGDDTRTDVGRGVHEKMVRTWLLPASIFALAMVVGWFLTA